VRKKNDGDAGILLGALETHLTKIFTQKSMEPKDFLGKMVEITVDRPLGSKHPQFGFIYPLNYGYVPGAFSPDGEELDAYIFGVFERVERYTGQCIAVIHRENDQDDKLVIVEKDRDFSDDQIRALTEFQERFFSSIILRGKTG
jgi:inorganic pyrophosphatase